MSLESTEQRKDCAKSCPRSLRQKTRTLRIYSLEHRLHWLAQPQTLSTPPRSTKPHFHSERSEIKASLVRFAILSRRTDYMKESTENPSSTAATNAASATALSAAGSINMRLTNARSAPFARSQRRLYQLRNNKTGQMVTDAKTFAPEEPSIRRQKSGAVVKKITSDPGFDFAMRADCSGSRTKSLQYK